MNVICTANFVLCAGILDSKLIIDNSPSGMRDSFSLSYPHNFPCPSALLLTYHQKILGFH